MMMMVHIHYTTIIIITIIVEDDNFVDKKRGETKDYLITKKLRTFSLVSASLTHKDTFEFGVAFFATWTVQLIFFWDDKDSNDGNLHE